MKHPERPFTLMVRSPSRRIFTNPDRAESDWNCKTCVWAEVLVELRARPFDPRRPDEDRWYLECYLDHEGVDQTHVCDCRSSTWITFWEVSQGRASAHVKAALLRTKLASYRPV